MNRLIKLFFLLAGGLLCTLYAGAQVNTGSLSGMVQDAGGAVASGTTVVAKNVETGLTQTVTTGPDGTYTLQYLPIGNYTLDVTSATFAPQTCTGITLVAAQDQRIDLTVRAKDVETTVQVSSEAQLIDTVRSQEQHFGP